MSYRVYKVIKKQELFCNDYDVYIDGRHVELNSARVSREVFNRRWPGHQRQIEQTELVNFISMSGKGRVNFKIYPRIPAEFAEIRPKKLGIIPKLNQDGSFEFSIENPTHFSFEPYGTHSALHVFMDNDEEYKVDKETEDVLYFGEGEHDVGLLELKSNQTLYIDEGAVLYATIDAFNVENIRIIGHGILDNSRNREKILFDVNVENNQADVGNAKRLYTIELDCAKNVEIDGITIRDSLCYNVNCCSCENLCINNIKVIGDWRYNSDGVHIVNCVNATLENCFLRTYDDSICVRGYTATELIRCEKIPEYLTVCKNIVVKNNVIWNDWGLGIRFGAATIGDEIKDVNFYDNDIIHISIYGIDALLCDYAVVSEIIFENTTIEFDEVNRQHFIQSHDGEYYTDHVIDKDNMLYLINLEILHHFEYSNVKANPLGKVSQLYNVCFKNTRVLGRQKIKLGFKGFDKAHMVKDVTFDGIYKNDVKLSEQDLVIDKNEFTDNIVIR